MSTYLAADFGGGSGRIMAGTLTEGKLKTGRGISFW